MNVLPETPFALHQTHVVDGSTVRYLDLKEICQGGPEIGTLEINGVEVEWANPFGGPMVIQDGFVFLPEFTRGFFRAGFRLARIRVSDLSVSTFGKVEPLLIIERIEPDAVAYYASLNKTQLRFCSLGTG